MTQSNQCMLNKIFWQIPALIVLAALVAVGVNQYRIDGIPLIGDWSAEARFMDAAGESLIITLEQAEQLFKRDAVRFVDARPHDQFIEGHIQGAMSLPWQEVDDYIVERFDRLAEAEGIIAYCDGESCDLSHELALYLKDMGLGKVHVLVNGWTVWQQAGLPTAIGR